MNGNIQKTLMNQIQRSDRKMSWDEEQLGYEDRAVSSASPGEEKLDWFVVEACVFQGPRIPKGTCWNTIAPPSKTLLDRID